MLEAKRTLVKSGPELWAEVSDPEALAGHLAPFGEIRITKITEPSLVEWEGERASGRLELEPSGFGTRVLLQAAPVVPEPVAPPPPPPAPEPAEPPRRGFFSRLFGRKQAAPPPPPPPPEPVPEPVAVAEIDDTEVVGVLTGVLDHLGTAHHRPFSR